eukprot:UN05836
MMSRLKLNGTHTYKFDFSVDDFIRKEGKGSVTNASLDNLRLP